MNNATQKEIDRWYKLKDQEDQLRLISENIRFPVIPAGRRSGKTERFKRHIVKESFRNPGYPYFAGAPTREQAKRIFWKDLKLLSFSSTHIKKPYETDLIIEMHNEATIHVIGFDKPERFEGQPWRGGGVDETGNLKPNAIQENILPALDTENPTDPTYKPWCWFFGVPEGLNHYYDLAQFAKTANDPEWRLYTWHSSAILSPEKIEAAKRRMSAIQFRQEYEASFETALGRIYEDYSEENHTSEEIQPHERIMWCHDQNYTPLSSAICTERERGLFILDEIVLTSAVSRQSALEFVEKYKDHKNKTVYIYGDPAGRAGEKHGHASDYTEIEDVLKEHGWSYDRRVSRAHPAIKDRQNSLRAKICNAMGERSLFVNPARAKYVDKGLSTVQLKGGSSFQEDQTNEFQHITTAVGYLTAYEYPVDSDNAIGIEIGGI
jgi:hypothetical protein